MSSNNQSSQQMNNSNNNNRDEEMLIEEQNVQAEDRSKLGGSTYQLSEEPQEMNQDYEDNQQDYVNHLEEEIRLLKRQLLEKNRPLPSPSRTTIHTTQFHSPSIADSESFQINEISKELMKLIPRYDGTGGFQKFFEFVDSFEDFATSTELPSQTELMVATAKLTGDAKLWWREHKQAVPIGDTTRIRDWNMLQNALMKVFVPTEAADKIRQQIHNIKQRGSVAEYNTSFRRLSMQIQMDFQEARFAYLNGLLPKIRDLIRTKENITDIRGLQLACLRLDDHSRSTESDIQESNALVTSTIRARGRHVFTSSRGRGRGRTHGHYNNNSHYSENRHLEQSMIQCYRCDEMGHKARDCPKKAKFEYNGKPQANVENSANLTSRTKA